ncbi:MAG: four helix bundle protein [Phycisphaerales bacterium]
MSDTIKTYRDLIAWQKAYDLTRRVYAAIASLPDHERFGMVASLRRTSVSIPSQIAAGYGKGSTSDYLWHLKSARAHLYELDTQLLLSFDLTYLNADQYSPLKSQLDESERVLAGLIRSLDR